MFVTLDSPIRGTQACSAFCFGIAISATHRQALESSWLGSGAKALASSVEVHQSNVKLQINVICLADKDVTDNYQIHFIASGSFYPLPLFYLHI